MTAKAIKYSVTKVKIANECPRKFYIHVKYKKNVFSGMGAPIGTFVHSIIQQFGERAITSKKLHERLLQQESPEKIFEEAFLILYQRKIREINLENWNEEELVQAWNFIKAFNHELTQLYLQFRKKFPQSLQSSHIREILKKIFLSQEWSFEIPLPKHSPPLVLTGRIDWLSLDPTENDIILWDFKTSPVENFVLDLQQVALYSYAVEKKMGINTKAALFYLTKDGIEKKEIPSQNLKKLQKMLLERLVDMYEWEHDKKPIPATQNKYVCEFCRVSDFCRKIFGENPYVPTMGKLWKELQEQSKKTTKLSTKHRIQRNKAASVLTVRSPMGKKSEPQVSSGADHAIKEEFHLGTIIATKEPYLIHPLVLNTHAAILGASGSGKTVLGKIIIEEALMRGYSALLIDPQGDLCSLVLKNEENPEKTTFLDNIDWKIFTPNSTKGIKLSINPFIPPDKKLLHDKDYLLNVIDSTATLILMIIGYDLKRNPPEKALLEAILYEEWMKNHTPSFKSLADRIKESQTVRSVTTGEIVNIDELITPRKRSSLVQNLFKMGVGTEGGFFIGGKELSLDELTAKPSLYIINLASVGTDITKRQLVVSWLLRSVYDWMLTHPQQVQDQIRFFLYIDEVADFLPPHPYNPPSKKMLLLLFRQARKYGVSTIIATQSPASIDYKALDNVRTFFIGRIPTKQSRKKLESFLEPYGAETAKKLMDESQKATPGEFIGIGAGTIAKFKTRRLYTQHLTLSLEDIQQLYKQRKKTT